MTKLKLWAAILSVAALAGLTTPAAAGTCYTLGDACDVTSVTTAPNINGLSNYYGESYAGLITFAINGVGSVNLLCDDLHHNVYLYSHETYHLEDASYYLMGSSADGNLTGLTATTAQMIVGLAYEAQLNAGNAAVDAEIQVALWNLEFPGFNGNPGNDPLITKWYADATNYYNAMLLAGYSVYELEDALAGCSLGHITFQSGGDPNSCQVQGQLYFTQDGKGHGIIVPEPGTLALLGVGLVGLGGIRRRRRTKSA